MSTKNESLPSGGLVKYALWLIEAGEENSTAPQCRAVIDILEDRARCFRLLYESGHPDLPGSRQGRPWMRAAAEKYEQLARDLRDLSTRSDDQDDQKDHPDQRPGCSPSSLSFSGKRRDNDRRQ